MGEWDGKVICCGPGSSGTRFLAKVVYENLGGDAYHQSMPHGDRWWTHKDFPGARFVIIQRRPDVTQLSVISHGYTEDYTVAREHWDRAIGILASIPDAYWISYEALMADTKVQIDNLAKWLGLPVLSYPTPKNGSTRWLSYLENRKRSELT
jgi:hypothetical protein